MSITPYKRTPVARPVALMLASGRCRTETGKILRLDDVGDLTTIYADNNTASRRAHAGSGRMYYFNDRPVRFVENARTVYMLPGDPGDGADVLAALAAFRDWLASRGAAGTTLASCAWSLLRATVERPVFTWGGPDPVPLTEVIGGRQVSAQPGFHPSFVQVDMSAAYASTLGELCYPGTWELMGSTRWRAMPIPEEDNPLPSYHHASVWIPRDVPLGPLPRRRQGRTPGGFVTRALTEREYPRNVEVQGIWSGTELRAAITAGCNPRINKTWLGIGDPDLRPFAPWWNAVKDARTLPGLAGTYGKLLGNALVGRFMSTVADRRWIEWNADNTIHDTKAVRSSKGPRHTKPLDLAELVTSGVRAKLYHDVLHPLAPHVIGAHTDGVLLGRVEPADLHLPEPWRVKTWGSGLIFIGPQTWAYRDQDRWQYTFSGVPSGQIPRAFAELARETYGDSWRRKITTTKGEPWQAKLPV